MNKRKYVRINLENVLTSVYMFGIIHLSETYRSDRKVR